MLTVKAKNEAVVADLHHFDEEQDPDLNQSESSDPDPHQSKKAGSGSAKLSIGTGRYPLWIKEMRCGVR